jgi:hypothetical protein
MSRTRIFLIKEGEVDILNYNLTGSSLQTIESSAIRIEQLMVAAACDMEAPLIIFHNQRLGNFQTALFVCGYLRGELSSGTPLDLSDFPDFIDQLNSIDSTTNIIAICNHEFVMEINTTIESPPGSFYVIGLVHLAEF